MIARPASLLCLVFSMAGTAAGQEFASFGTQDGLPSVIVEDVAQDGDGFIWVATQGGLVRFDGRAFNVYKASPTRPGYLRDEYVHTVLFHDGRLVVGTNQGGLHSLNPKTNEIGRFPIPTGIGAADVRSLSATPDGRLLVGTYGAGLFEAHLASHTLEPLGAGNDTPSARIQSMAPSVAFPGLIWLVTGDGLRAFDLTTESFVPLALPHGLPARVTDVDEIDGKLAVASEAGLFLVEVDHASTTIALSIRDRSSMAGSLADAFVRKILSTASTDNGPLLVLGTESAGIQRVRLGGNGFSFQAPAGLEAGLESNRITALFEDRQGILWVGTWGGGLSKARPSPRFSHITPSDPGGPPPATILGMTASAGKPEAWLATLGGGLVRWDRTANRFTAYFNQPGHRLQSLGMVHEDAQGTLWTGRNADTLYQIAPGPPARIVAAYPLPTGDDPGWLRTAAESDTHPNTLWLGTQRAGLLRFDTQTRRVTGHWTHAPSDPTSIPADELWGIHPTTGGQLWIGTVAGLTRFDPLEGTFRTFTHDPYDQRTLSSNRIATVVQDTSGILWAGASDNGFNALDPSTGLVERFMPENGLPDDEVGNLTIDSFGMLWLGTNNGLTRLNPYDRQFSYFEPADGLHGRVFTYLSGDQTHDGEIMLGGPNGGITYFQPEALALHDDPPAAAITRVAIDDSVLFSAPVFGAGPIARGTYRRNDIEVRFAALDYRAPEKNRFRVLLTGAGDSKPTEQSEAFVRYPNLAPGRYRLHIWAASSDGFYNDAPASIGLHISPPFWQAAWFYVLSGVLIGGVVATGYSYRINQLRRVERERQRIADDLHDDLGGKLSGIALRLELLSRSSPIDPDQLARLSAASRSAISDLRNTIWLVGSGQDDVSSLVARLESVASEILVGLRYRFDIGSASADRVLLPETRRQVFLIFREGLHNIVKHARASSVVIEVSRGKSLLRIRLVDDGVGVDPSAGRGNGIRSMKQRANSLGGRLTLTRGENGGTELYLEVPL